ncbi:FG-GAP repeat protein [Thermomonospora curvata DSM 43183]|uniref:FG-GAP repeat protein n=1 Tax=Thermomonospora curvata (strain ATCC 19995 / DSM 43183 / JCM 3096 / KCTC 9072 / NBRC 15933 / NCIMB 10081 / Henssen B9) TaxID=471852 RepID=D1AE94_THECD|nr:FG-GAP repeat protein [Thermomonospora curvata DSM 43183]
MRSGVFARLVAVATTAALGGAVLSAFAPSASAAAPAKPYDFNGDGYVDLAIGSPNGKVGKKAGAGFVSVIYGSAKGLNTAKKKVFTQNSKGIPGTAEAGDNFGYSLASADFDRDGYADLAIGAPGEDTAAGANAGTVTILWGTRSGLTTLAGSSAEFGDPGRNHRWGESLAVGDIQQDGSPELFITVPGTSMFKWFYFRPPAAASGAAVRPGAAMEPGGAKALPRRRGGVAAQSADDVNASWLATGDVTGDGHDDVVYAWHDADWPAPAERRGFVVLPGTAAGRLGDAVSVVFTEVKSLAVGDFNGDRRKDVAVGQSSAKGGRVAVFPGSASGVNSATRTVIDQDSPGVPGAGASGDGFGTAIAVGDVNKDGKADLAVGTPFDEVSGRKDAGRAYVLFGSASGLTGKGAQTVSQSTKGVPGASEKNDNFGFGVTLLDHTKDGRADLVVGAPRENGRDGAVTFFKSRGKAGFLPVLSVRAVGAGTFGVKGRNARLGGVLGR